MAPLNDDEFRLLAYLRGYADRCEQHFDPEWIQEQLQFSMDRMQKASRGLAARKLVELFEWSPSKIALLEHPEIGEGPHMTDIRLTDYGWLFLRGQEG